MGDVELTLVYVGIKNDGREVGCLVGFCDTVGFGVGGALLGDTLGAEVGFTEGKCVVGVQVGGALEEELGLSVGDGCGVGVEI